MLEAEGRELDELNDLVGRTSKLETMVKHLQKHAKVISVRNSLVGLNGGTDSPRPINIEFKLLRRSGRQASQTKRSYDNMQGANKAKKQKLAADEPATDGLATDEPATDEHATDEPATDEPATDEPATEPTTLESTDDPAIIEPNTMEPLGTSREDTGRQGTDEVMVRSRVATTMEDDETTVGGAVEGNLPSITHADGITILDEYFPKSAIDSSPLTPVVWPHAPEPLTAPPSAGSNAVSTEVAGNLDPDQAIGGFEMSKSTSSTGSLESLSSCTDLTSHLSSDTDIVDNALPDAVKQRPFARRSILDDSVQWLEDVVVALEHVDDNSRTPDSSVPGVLDDVLKTTINRPNFVNIMSSVTEDWAKCNRLIAKPALEVAQESLGKVDQNKLHGIPADRDQVKKARAERAKSERLKHAVACCDVRELSKIAMQDLLSEPAELMGEFSKESDYENAMKHIEKENANDTRTQLRRLWKETYYWPMIQQRAKMIGPLPKSSGPKTEITPQEKLAAKKLIVAMGYGQSRNSIFKWTSYLRLLSDLRDRGTTAFLLCRTSEFKTHFFQHPKELDMLLSWHKVYDFPLRQLRLRVIAEEANDFSGKSDIEEEWLRDRLHAPQNMRWGDHLSAWDQDSTEYENFLADHSLKPTSGKSNTYVLRHGIKGQLDRNMAIYVSFVPYEGEPDKRTFSNKTASTELLAVAPLVAVAPGDFLGIFPGRLRYTDQKPTRAIRGPVPNLWLDHSETMGKLNKIKVAKAGEMTNVCLAWEGVNEVKGDKSFCQYLRVLVIATRHILPFDQLVRPSSGTAVLSAEDGRLGSRGRE